jgi:hypothetical protein
MRKTDMTEEEKETSNSLRRELIKLLELLSDPVEQKNYAEQFGSETAISEMICKWFDDQYQPKFKLFIAGFTQKELEALAAFNSYYDPIVDKLPEHNIDELLSEPLWDELIQKAQQTLVLLKVGM